MLELLEDHLILISRIYFSNKNYAFSQQYYNSIIYIIIYFTTKFIKFEAYIKMYMHRLSFSSKCFYYLIFSILRSLKKIRLHTYALSELKISFQRQ